MNQNIYNQSKIYKIEPITEHEEHEIYIGSTTKKYLSQRLQQHKSSYKAFLDNNASKVYVYDLFNKYGIDKFNIYLLENYNCNDINELRAKEGEYIKKLACINKRIEDRTKKEYDKEYYETNKEKIKEYKKEYYQNNKEKIIVHVKDYQKEYYENNKELIKEKNKQYDKEYYKNNKDKILERGKIKVICPCGCEILKRELKIHQRTNKHLNLIKSKEQKENNIIQ